MKFVRSTRYDIPDNSLFFYVRLEGFCAFVVSGLITHTLLPNQTAL